MSPHPFGPNPSKPCVHSFASVRAEPVEAFPFPRPFGLRYRSLSPFPVRPEVSKDRVEISKPFTVKPFGLSLSKPCSQLRTGLFDKT